MSCGKMRKIKTVSVFLALLLSGCANEEAALGVQVSKKVDDEKLSLIVLSKSERNSEAEEQEKLKMRCRIFSLKRWKILTEY